MGKPHVGQTLTADTSGIEDPNGVPNRFSYQWKAGDSDIPGATGSTYTLQAADNGKTFKVEVSFTDDAGYKESLTSGATPAVGELHAREVWTAKMTVGTGPSGHLGYHHTDYTGDSLTDTSFTTSAGDHTVRQVSFLRGETRFTVTGELPEAAEQDWLLYLGNLQFPLANASKQTSVLVTAFSWSQPKPAWQSGDKVDVALWRVNVPATGAPAIKGATQVGDLLTVDTTRIRDSDGIPEDVAFTYQWYSRDGDDDVDISGATGSSYVVTGQEPSNFLRVRVGFTDGNGFDEIGHQQRGGMAAAGRNLDGRADRGARLLARQDRIRDSTLKARRPERHHVYLRGHGLHDIYNPHNRHISYGSAPNKHECQLC